MKNILIIAIAAGVVAIAAAILFTARAGPTSAQQTDETRPFDMSADRDGNDVPDDFENAYRELMETAADGGLGPGPVPPWVNPDGTIDIDELPDRMPVADRNGNMVGYMLIDKNPNDDPNPGDPGFEEWNYGPVQVTDESGELVGHMQSGSPGGTQMFEPLTSTVVNENGHSGSGGSGASPE